MSLRGKAIDIEDFVKLSKKKFGEDSFDYSKTITNRKRDPIKLICKKHNLEFETKPYLHLHETTKNSCPKCIKEYIKNTPRYKKTTSSFIESCKIKFGDKYSYDKTVFVSDYTKCIIKCNECDYEFEQRPDNFYNGKVRCPVCSKSNNINTDIFIKRSKILYGDRYDYSFTYYVNGRSKLKIRCKEHNVIFECLPDNHYKYDLQCDKCFSTKSLKSKVETEWLNSLNLPDDFNHRQVPIKLPNKRNPIRVDGFDPKTNTVYLFHGTFYHGHPDYYYPEDINPVSGKTYKYLYKQTLEQEKALTSNGYNLIVMWEHDYKKNLNMRKI